MQQEVKSKISNPDRIARIIMRMCEGGMYALIRTDNETKVGIRSNFHMVETGTDPAQIFFSGISEYGLEKIVVGSVVRFEVIGMPSKVIFQSKIIKKMGAGGVICEIPPALISIERRSATRATTNSRLMSYMSLGVWNPGRESIDAPPVFEHHREISNWVSVLDISVGGVCLKSHFPSVQTSLFGIEQDRNARLFLPMTEPMVIPVAFRWQKRIKNRHASDGVERYQQDYRVGVEFLHLNDEQMMKVKHFIRQLSVADAI